MCNIINKIKHYLVEVKNSSPLRIGNGDYEGLGVLVLDNHALISGTTIAGLFAKFLLKQNITKIYELIFPDDKNISKLYFYDSISNEEIKNKDLVCRKHIKIDEKSGTAVDEFLFDEYHIAEGKTFQIVFEVRGLETQEDDYKLICKYVEQFISLIANGQISVGSKTTFGFGVLKNLEKNNYYFKEYNLSKKEDFNNYLSITSICKNTLNTEELVKVNNTRTYITFKGYCKDGFIIKGQIAKKENIQIEESYSELINNNNMFLIPSSTIKGIVRNYANKIYKTLGKDDEELNDIFGKRGNGNEKVKTEEISKGKVIFSDCKIQNNKNQIYNRIKIDRFTGGAMDGNIFRENVVIVTKENPIEFRVAIDTDNANIMAVIILAFRDIGLGYLTVGSGNNVGYGRFKGLSITKSKDDTNNIKVDFQDGKLIGDIEEFNKLISSLNEEKVSK